MEEEVGPQDKEWLPKIETQVDLPPMLRGGAYKIQVKVEDVLAKTSAELAVPFQVHAKDVPASAALTVRNFQWYHTDEEESPQAQTERTSSGTTPTRKRGRWRGRCTTPATTCG